MSTYVFDQTWQLERDRLGALEDLYNDASIRFLAAVGVHEGWRCLEVGCGAGGVALWLADRVGSSGHVVATDVDPRFLTGHGRDNLAVLRHDIRTDLLDEASFDLVHARAVLEHLPDRQAVLARLARAVRPGGWVVIEDVDFVDATATAMSRYVCPPEAAHLFERMAHGIQAVFAAAGADGGFGPRLPAAMMAAGLDNVDAEVFGPVTRGGHERDFVRFTMQQLRVPLVTGGLLTEDEIDRIIEVTSQPTSRYLTPFLVSVRGQRPFN